MKISYVFMALIALGSGLLLLGLLGFRFNLSSSLPPGVYRVVAEPATRGSVVHVCLPVDVAEFARRRGYLGPGSCAAGVRPLGKIVVAIEGDVVALSRDGIRVNGEAMPNSVTVSKEAGICRTSPGVFIGCGEARSGSSLHTIAARTTPATSGR